MLIHRRIFQTLGIRLTALNKQYIKNKFKVGRNEY